MAKKSTTPKKRPTTTAKKIKKTTNQINWPALAVLVIAALIGVSVAVINTNKKPGPHELDARGTADAFMKAMSDCDAAAVRQYAPFIALNEEKMKQFEQNCKPGVVTSQYVRGTTSGAGQQLTNDSSDQAATFTYKVHDESQVNYKDSNLVIQVVKPSDKEPWQVLLASGVPILDH